MASVQQNQAEKAGWRTVKFKQFWGWLNIIGGTSLHINVRKLKTVSRTNHSILFLNSWLFFFSSWLPQFHYNVQYYVRLFFIYKNKNTVHVYILPYIKLCLEVSHKGIFLSEVKPIMSCFICCFWLCIFISSLCFGKPWEQLWGMAHVT